MKGVFCVEGFWYGDHRDDTSVYPVLDLVHRCEKVPFKYHRCGTVAEFAYSVSRWRTKSFHKKYPLLYLAFHGAKGLIRIGKDTISLDQLAELLQDKCERVVIFFGSCATMQIREDQLQAFMEKTRVLAVLGYRKDVDWLSSASFEILLLRHLLLTHPFDSRGIRKIQEELYHSRKRQIEELHFLMVTNKRIPFPRKRNPQTKNNSL